MSGIGWERFFSYGHDLSTVLSRCSFSHKRAPVVQKLSDHASCLGTVPCRKCLILRAWTLPQVLHAVQQVAQCFVTLLARVADAARHGATKLFEPLCHRLLFSPFSRLLA